MAQQQTSSTTWALIAGACLILGLAAGYVIFGSHQAAVPVAQVPVAPAPTPAAGGPQPGLMDEQQAQALRNILAKDPTNLQANTQLGNLYYDAGRFADAVGPYQQAFNADPKNVAVSTDLGTALWYAGRPDEAIAQFAKSLALDPNHPQTLYNLGVVKRDGKQDYAGAIQAWEKLIATNPDYAGKADVQRSLEQLKAQQKAVPPVAPVRSTK